MGNQPYIGTEADPAHQPFFYKDGTDQLRAHVQGGRMQKDDHVTVSTPAQQHPKYYEYMGEYMQLLDILTAHPPVVRAILECETADGALARILLLARDPSGLVVARTAASTARKLLSSPENNSNQAREQLRRLNAEKRCAWC